MIPYAAAVSGSSVSYPTMESRRIARSRTLRAIGPSDVNKAGQPSHIPVRLTRPADGCIPTRLFHVDGRRIEAEPSSPTPTVAKFDARPAPVPPDEPPGVRSSAYGFLVAPNKEPNAFPPPNSPSVVFPMTIAPAFLSLAIAN